MKLFKFFGAICEIAGKPKLSKLAQEITLEVELAKEFIRTGGAAILPAEDFDKIGFTQAEIKSRSARNSDGYTAKIHEAMKVWNELREQYNSVSETEVEAAVEEVTPNEEVN